MKVEATGQHRSG